MTCIIGGGAVMAFAPRSWNGLSDGNRDASNQKNGWFFLPNTKKFKK